jgi:ADP-ribose pyrophosphatase
VSRVEGEVDVLGTGRFLRLVRRGKWEFAHRVDSDGVVVLVAVTPGGELLLVEQHRGSVDKLCIELPAGLSGDDDKAGEDLTEAARRELEEETGWLPGRVEYLCEGPVSAGMSSEVLTWFRCHDLEKVGDGGGDQHEDITVHAVPLAEVPTFLERMVAEGRIVDTKVYAGLYWATQG